MSKQADLTKVTAITVIGLAILLLSLFWLKGYKLNGNQKITVYFQDVSGLEEGAIVRWSGFRVGVVESLRPLIGEKKTTAKGTKNKFEIRSENKLKEAKELGSKLAKTKNANERQKLKDQIKELKEIAGIHDRQGLAFAEQEKIYKGSCVEVNLVITKANVPLGPLSRISIVPTGLIGEHNVDITPVVGRGTLKADFETAFIIGEPLRFERLLKANIESSEAFRDALGKVNDLLRKDDIDLLRDTVKDARNVVKDINKLIDNAHILLATTSSKLEELATSSNLLSSSVVQVGENINTILGDKQLIADLKHTVASINIISTEVSNLLGEGGISKDILEISERAKGTSIEASQFIKELRQTNEELELPKTISNLNSLAEKLDTLTTELTNIAADEQFKEDIKITVQKARETSENLEKMSKKFSKRFLLFRLLF